MTRYAGDDDKEEGAVAMRLMDKWISGERVAPEPLEGNVTGTVLAGSVIWFVLFLVQLPFYGWFEERGDTWWIWTCAAGAGLGLVGLWYVRRREAAIRRSEAAGPTGGTGTGADPSAS